MKSWNNPSYSTRLLMNIQFDMKSFWPFFRENIDKYLHFLAPKISDIIPKFSLYHMLSCFPSIFTALYSTILSEWIVPNFLFFFFSVTNLCCCYSKPISLSSALKCLRTYKAVTLVNICLSSPNIFPSPYAKLLSSSYWQTNTFIKCSA